jgi:hypothetical protein
MLALSVPVVLSGTACGQEALRQSQTGAAAAAGQQSANATVGYYNLKMGDLTLRVLSGASVQYNDNVRLRSGAAGGGGAPDDFIFVPSVSTQLHYPVTQHNSLDLSITAGYTTYLQHSELNQFYVNPGSGLTFNIFIGDLVINLHDRVSVSQSGYQNPTANGNGNNSSLENNAGVTASWNLNKLDLAAGYNHGNYISLGSGLVTPDASTDNIFLNAGATVRPELVLGAEVGATSASYNRANTYGTPNLQQWSAGMFSRWKITDYMNAQAHVGYSQTIPEGNTSTNLNVGSGGGMYFGVTFAHRVNQVFSYTLAAERSQNLQSYGQAYETYSVRWSPSYQLFRKFSVSTPVWWTKGTQFYNQANSYEQYGLGLNVERQLTEKLAGAFTYQFINETSDEASLNYVVNIISLTLTYRF